MKTSRTISILISTLLILVSFIGYSSFVVPVLERAKALRGEMKVKAEFYAEQRAAIERVRALFSQFEENAVLQETLKSILPVGDAKAAILLEQIRGLAKLNGLALQNISMSERTIKSSPLGIPLAGGIGVVSMNFAASGNYSALKNFLSALETNVRIMDVSSLGLEPVGNLDLLNINFAVDVYYQAKSL